MDEDRLRRFLLLTASAAAATALFYLTVRYLLWWLLPFLFAFAAAGALEPAVRLICRRTGMRRSMAALVLTVFLLFLFGGLLALLGTALAGEAYALLDRLPSLFTRLGGALDGVSAWLARYGGDLPPRLRELALEALHALPEELGTLSGRLLSLLAGAAAAVPRTLLAFATAILALYYTTATYPGLCAAIRAPLSRAGVRRLRLLRTGAARSLEHWLRAELILCAVTFSEVLAALALLHEPYAVLLALFITLVDALPVFGTGTVLLPWALGALLLGNAGRAASLAALYLLTLAVRSTLEPRLLGARSGVPPVLSLASMYLGFHALGVGGMVLFPFLLLFAAQVWRETQKSA